MTLAATCGRLRAMKLDKSVVIGAIAAVLLLAVGGGLVAYVVRDTASEET
ncbi:hypothetical protein [Caulobacter zeae]|nr:hypothetical protein [Caulobacter zeae]